MAAQRSVHWLFCTWLTFQTMGSAAATYTADSPGAAQWSLTLTNTASLTSVTQRVPSLPTAAGTPIFWLDTSVTSGWTFAAANGTNFVTRCPSATGDGRSLVFNSNGGAWLNGPFLRTGAAELNGGSVLDFGPRGSRLGLYFDGGKLDNIGTVVAVWGSQNGGGWILGGGLWTNTVGYVHSGYGFHRGNNPLDSNSAGDDAIVAESRLIKDGVTYPAYNQSRCWLDGTEVNPLAMGFSGNYQLLSIVCTNLVPWAAGIGINDVRSTVRSGGQRIAELLIYGKLLSEPERLSVEAYLTAKWFSRPYAGYNGRAAVASVRLTVTNEIAVAENETLSLTTVWGGEHQGRTVKSGAGTLELADAAGFGGTLTWQAGDLAVPRRAVASALPTNPVFRVDASVAGSLDTVADANGALRVTAWRDADGRAFAASSFYATNRPTLMTNALNGRTVVDFGTYASGQFLQWNTNMSYIGTVLWVVGAQNGGGNLMGHSSDNNCHFQRGGSGGSQTSPLWSSAGIKVAMRACPTYINGVRVNGTNAYLGYGYHVVAVQTPGAFANQFAGHLSTTNDLSRTGGQRLAEVVAYNRLLTDQELADAQAYLMRKWLNADAPGYVRQSRSRPDLQDLDAEGSGNLTVANNTVRIGALSGNGSFTKTGDGDLEVTSLSNFVGAVAVQGGNLRIVASSVTNNVPADEPIFRLDASRTDSLEMFAQNGTNFITQWTDVSGWRNAARRWDTSASRPLPWLRTDDPANGLPTVDFGPRASCRALVFDKPVKNIRAAYLVVGTQNGCGNFLLGSTGSEGTYDFHRGGDDTTDLLTRPIIATYAPCQPLRDGLIYIDGAQTNANAGLSGSYQLVEFHPTAGMSASALACDRYSGLIDVGDLGSEGARRTGGQRLCEVILYDRPLSPRERTATRNYLMQKWLNRTPAALPSESTASTLRQLTASAATNISLRTENALSVTVLAGAGGVVKTGSATLSVVDASAFTGTVRVAEGVLELTGQPLATAPALPTDGLTFHVDATTNVEWTLTNGVRSVTRWVSTVGDGCYAYPPENKPEYKAGDLAGQPVVDLGAMGSLRHMLFVNPNATGGATGRITNIRSIFWVLGSQGGAGYLLGGGTNASNAAAHYNFHRGPKPGSNDVANPITPDHYLWGGPSDPAIVDATSTTYLNGTATNGTTTGLSGGYDLIGLVLNQKATEAEGFAFDGRYLDSKSFGNRSGGQRIAEFLTYNRALSTSERLGLESYLQKKWLLGNHRFGEYSALALLVDAQATVSLAGTQQSVAYLSGSGVVTNGTLTVLNGIGAGAAEGEIAALAIAGGLTLADGATIDVDLAPPAADAITVAGTCTLGANVTVNLRNAASVRGTALYRTPILACGSLASAAHVSTWTVTGDLPSGYVAAISAEGGTVWLRLSRQGFLMLVK